MIQEKEFVLSTPGHMTEFGYDGRTLRVFGALPSAGVGGNTGILVVSLGKANPPENPFYFKLRRALADAYDLVCLGVEILGTCAQRTRKMELGLVSPEKFYSAFPCIATSGKSGNCLPKEVIHLPSLVKKLSGRDLSEYVYFKETLPDGGPHDYLDYGVVQAMDVLTAIFEVKTRYNCRDDRIFMVGSSLGAFLSQMVRKFAPRTLAWILDISGQAWLESGFFLRGHRFRGIYDSDNTVVGIINDNIYSEDPESPYHFSVDKACIRSHLEEDHYHQAPAEGQAMTVITGSEDSVVHLRQKVLQVEKLRRNGADVRFIVVKPSDVDGRVLKHAGHSLGADFYSLIRLLGHDVLGSVRNTRQTDFENSSHYRYNTPNGVYSVDFSNGKPKLTFELCHGKICLQ